MSTRTCARGTKALAATCRDRPSSIIAGVVVGRRPGDPRLARRGPLAPGDEEVERERSTNDHACSSSLGVVFGVIVALPFAPAAGDDDRPHDGKMEGTND